MPGLEIGNLTTDGDTHTKNQSLKRAPDIGHTNKARIQNMCVWSI